MVASTREGKKFLIMELFYAVLKEKTENKRRLNICANDSCRMTFVINETKKKRNSKIEQKES